MPRCIVADTLGPPENYRIEDRPCAELRPDQARVTLKAAGISFVDVLTASGRYQVKPPTPFVPASTGSTP